MSLFYAVVLTFASGAHPLTGNLQYMGDPVSHAECRAWQAQMTEAAEIVGMAIGVPGVSFLCLPATDVPGGEA